MTPHEEEVTRDVTAATVCLLMTEVFTKGPRQIRERLASELHRYIEASMKTAIQLARPQQVGKEPGRN